MFKCHIEVNPKYINDMFSISKPMYYFRDDKKFKMYSYKTKGHGYKSVSYAGAKLWNSIPVHIKSSVSINEFKLSLMNWKCNTVDCGHCLNFIYHE